MVKVLVIAPHPDDETLGCGGTLLRHKSQGDEINWLVMTSIKTSKDFSEKMVNKRNLEIKKIIKEYKFKNYENFDIPTKFLDQIPFVTLVDKLNQYLKKIKPEIIYIPYKYDVHSDHQITAEVVNSSVKSFRHLYLKKILMYETLSETNFNFMHEEQFHPNVFIDISKFIEKKIFIMNIYKSEIKSHPFPRSNNAIKSLSILRGSQSGFKAAESFQLLFEKK